LEWLKLSPEEWVAVRLSHCRGKLGDDCQPAARHCRRLAVGARQFLGKSVLNGVVHLPLILPPVVTGYLLLITFGRRGPAGAFLEQCCGIVLSFRWTGAVLACAVMAFPLMVRAIRLFDRGSRPASGVRGWNARRQPRLGIRHRDFAADPARHYRGHDPLLRQSNG
jgi:molybdate transport system permease protein